MPDTKHTRRRMFYAAGSAGVAIAAAALVGCQHDEDEGEVTANEDLMREHGVIRRVLLVYSEAARRSRTKPSALPLPSLLDAAQLFRLFAEDYHERGLEEAHIFPVVRKIKGPAAQLPDVLLAQHQRGREITDYIRVIAAGASVAASAAERFATTLDAFVAMYEPHAAWEDTVLFPAWKAALGNEHYEDMGDQFEALEQKMFGHDGFEYARDRIAKIELAFGLGDLARVTAPAPPTI